LLQETFDFYALTTAAAKRENQVDFSPKKKNQVDFSIATFLQFLQPENPF
jgi:hypothetical protein